ncbi:hypothetical protein H5410_057727 [Solanum commersonii]|uniref:SWIM-type domain-containing protein n=1 Tax=Solanum commersonii TaxID=4109 RepID=A0A9J5WNY1_SOLCO|nr:hypothetical protein H5410_057727 [Solanum commersonii]
MSGFTLVTLRWYHGGVLDLSSGQLVYSGGQVTEFLDVDVDRLSYFELRGYIKELGYTTTCTFSIKPPNSGILEDIHNDMDILDLSYSLEDGDIVEVYVKHLIDDAVVDPTLILLENVPHGDMEESGSTFNKVNEQSGVGEDPFTTFDTRSASTPTPPTTTSSPRSPFTTTTHSTTTAAPKSPSTKTPPTTTAAPRSPSTTTPVTAANPSIEDADDLVSGPVESDFLEKEGSDYSTEDSVESECGLVGDDEEDYGSDVHEEVRELRAEKRSFQRRKRKERVPADTEKVPVGEAGADLGFDETQTGKISVEGRLGGDEPYFASSDDGSFEINEDEFSDECVESERVHLPRTVKRRRRPNNQKIIHDPTAKKVVWRLGERSPKKTTFWSIAKSTFESQLRKNVAKMKLLGPEKMMDDLMYYNIEYWCKVYFNSQVKCDSVDNNMSECFNSWILAARHKTIITMLDEIRVKMMTRIAKLREFTNTWMCDFSPMSLKVLQENIDRSVNCNIEFNGVDGFEVKEGPFQHSVDLGRWTCSCRVWQLKGIPCAHVVAAIYFKKCEPLDYIDNCYSKATYLRTYANVLQPVTNMEMWPVSTTVAPPEIKSMHSRGHNKRGCPQRVESSTREEPSNIDKGNGKTSGLGRPKKAQTEGEHSTKRSRGRPPAAPSASPGPAKRSRGRPPAAPSASPGPAKRSRGRPPAAPSASPGPAKRSRGRPLAVPSASAALTKGARGRPPIAPATPNASATPAKSARGSPTAAASAPPTCPSPANYHVGMGVFQDENGFKALNPGMSSCKIFSTGTTKVTKSADVTGDIGYKPSTAPKLKWNGKAAISTRKLQEMREEQRKKSKRSSSNNPI